MDIDQFTDVLLRHGGLIHKVAYRIANNGSEFRWTTPVMG
jgi:hypothetical protein